MESQSTEPWRIVPFSEAEVEQLPGKTHYWHCKPGMVADTNLMFVRAQLPPGEAHRFHHHPMMEEILYILSGTAEQWVEREKRIMREGDSIYIPVGMIHGTYNVGSEPLDFLAVLSPAKSPGPVTVEVADDWLGRLSRSRLGVDMVASFFGMPELPTSLWNLRFPNPVGLAAGMDKTAQAVPAWAALGFGFSEIGGTTWHPQPGNPPPRMFRVIPDEALINRMGFNNPGAEAIANRLRSWKSSGLWPPHPVGINLGKSKVTALEHAADDYSRSFRALRPYADFFVVNVSSPNTPNLRALQDRTALDEILSAMQEINHGDANPKPILVKVAPDLAFEALDEILELAGPRQLSGIVATNTTIARPPDSTHASYAETGGLSGRPLARRSTEVVRHLFCQSSGRLPIIGVGGIFNARDAWEKITAGAALVQVYTGLVYEGPKITREITEGLYELLAAHGFNAIHQAVGLHARSPSGNPEFQA